MCTMTYPLKYVRFCQRRECVYMFLSSTYCKLGSLSLCASSAKQAGKQVFTERKLLHSVQLLAFIMCESSSQ